MGFIYTVVAVALGSMFVLKAARLRRDFSPQAALKLFHFSITYLTALFVAIGVDVVVHVR